MKKLLMALFTVLIISVSVTTTMLICTCKHDKELRDMERRIRFEYEEKTFVIPEKLKQGETYQRLWGDND